MARDGNENLRENAPNARRQPEVQAEVDYGYGDAAPSQRSPANLVPQENEPAVRREPIPRRRAVNVSGPQLEQPQLPVVRDEIEVVAESRTQSAVIESDEEEASLSKKQKLSNSKDDHTKSWTKREDDRSNDRGGSSGLAM